jgi:hypothetical protein
MNVIKGGYVPVFHENHIASEASGASDFFSTDP